MYQGSGGLTYLGRELRRRLLTPIGHFTFWVYLITGVILCGGFGVWYEFLPLLLSRAGSSSEGVYTALLTFFPALAGSSALQLLFGEGQKPLKAFSVVYCFVFATIAVWLGFAKPEDPKYAFGGAVLGCVLAIFMWWLTSGQDPAFNDDIDDTTPLGGNPDAQPQGSLKGFQT